MEDEFNLYVDQGITFKYPLILMEDDGITPVDFTNTIVLAQMRSGYRSTTAYNFTCITGANGYIELQLPSSLTVNIPLGRYVFDAVYYKGSDVVKFAKGIVVLSPTITKP